MWWGGRGRRVFAAFRPPRNGPMHRHCISENWLGSQRCPSAGCARNALRNTIAPAELRAKWVGDNFAEDTGALLYFTPAPIATKRFALVETDRVEAAHHRCWIDLCCGCAAVALVATRLSRSASRPFPGSHPESHPAHRQRSRALAAGRGFTNPAQTRSVR